MNYEVHEKEEKETGNNQEAERRNFGWGQIIQESQSKE